jgi:hypothetical protein
MFVGQRRTRDEEQLLHKQRLARPRRQELILIEDSDFQCIGRNFVLQTKAVSVGYADSHLGQGGAAFLENSGDQFSARAKP